MSDEEELLVIAASGNLILDVAQEEGGQRCSYRVDSKILQQNSRYFENLLSDRFNEGVQLAKALDALKLGEHANIADAPVDVLPHIAIINVGRVAVAKASSIFNLLADFLRAVHGYGLAVANPPVANIANLAVVADRFDAVACLARYVQRKKYLQLLDAKSRRKRGYGRSCSSAYCSTTHRGSRDTRSISSCGIRCSGDRRRRKIIQRLCGGTYRTAWKTS
jgi:hypothetical protein